MKGKREDVIQTLADAGITAVATPHSPWGLRIDGKPALSKLDQLDSAGKQLLIEAMVTTISHDGRIAVAEAELLRVACAALHCPLPPLLAR